MSRVGRIVLAAALAATGAGGAASCGEVPTMENGIAYITTIRLPSPVVEAGGVMRDSLGNPAPLRVQAFDRDSNLVTDAPVTFVVTPVDTGAHIDASGLLSVSDSIRTISFVARMGSALQTPAASVDVVPAPTAIARKSPPGGPADTTMTLPASVVDSVVVTGVNKTGATIGIHGITVRYAVDSVYTKTAGSSTVVLTDDQARSLRGMETLAVDTTDASGLASRHLTVAGTGVDSVVVRVRANDLRGRPLPGSPVRFVLRVKP